MDFSGVQRALINEYKLNDKRVSKAERLRRRRQSSEGILDELIVQYSESHRVDATCRDKVVQDDNKLKALFCAVAARGRSIGHFARYPGEDLPTSQSSTEGYVFARWGWQSLPS